jgi:SAM-dependent methyltransferase
VAAVTAGDAFHWFDPAPALAEIARVLQPRGGLALFTSFMDWRGTSWGHEVGTLMADLRPTHPHFDGPPLEDSLAAAGGWDPARSIRLIYDQPAVPERILDHIASMSWIASMPDEEREATLARIGEAILAGETPSQLPVHVGIRFARRSA